MRCVVDTLSSAVSTTQPKRCHLRDLRQRSFSMPLFGLLLPRDPRLRHVYDAEPLIPQGFLQMDLR